MINFDKRLREIFNESNQQYSQHHDCLYVTDLIIVTNGGIDGEGEELKFCILVGRLEADGSGEGYEKTGRK